MSGTAEEYFVLIWEVRNLRHDVRTNMWFDQHQKTANGTSWKPHFGTQAINSSPALVMTGVSSWSLPFSVGFQTNLSQMPRKTLNPTEQCRNPAGRCMQWRNCQHPGHNVGSAKRTNFVTFHWTPTSSSTQKPTQSQQQPDSRQELPTGSGLWKTSVHL